MKSMMSASTDQWNQLCQPAQINEINDVSQHRSVKSMMSASTDQWNQWSQHRSMKSMQPASIDQRISEISLYRRMNQSSQPVQISESVKSASTDEWISQVSQYRSTNQSSQPVQMNQSTQPAETYNYYLRRRRRRGRWKPWLWSQPGGSHRQLNN